MDDPHALDPSTDGVDAALRLGFGGGGTSIPGEDSVLRALDSKLGEAPRRLLREEEQGDVGSPPVIGIDTTELELAPGHGRYRVIGELARGGMGVVLKAHDEDLCRDVALKVLSRRLKGDPALIGRFVEEAQVGGQLQHPGIVPVFELGLMADEQPYIAMKLVKGRTLSNLLLGRESPSSELRRFLGIFEQVSQTVAYAHSRGVIHRDLKPANVMVGAFGEVQVVDWGLAKVLRSGGTADEKHAKKLASEVSVVETVRSGDGSGESDSRVGSVMGTPAYMSPEQARGEVLSLDERTDVFALGALLCEVLTGRPPYVGEETVFEAAEARLEGAQERLAQCGADAALVALCERCLRPARVARPRNAEVVAAEIGAYLVSVEERAQAARIDAGVARGRAAAERKARRVTVALASSLILAGIAGVVGWRTVEGRERIRVERVESEVQAALDEALMARADGRLAEALSAAKRAQSLAAAEVIGGGLDARTRELVTAIADEEAAASAALEQEAREARLLVQLERVRLIEPHSPLEEFERGDAPWHGGPMPVSAEERASQWERRAAAYAAVLASNDFGLGADDEPFVARIAASDVAREIAAALDDWARVLRNLEGSEEEARRLVRLAGRVDADDWRGRVRDALLQEDSAALLALASDPRTAELPAASLFLLGLLLTNEQHPDVAVELLSAGVEAHPADFALRDQLGRSLEELDRPLHEDAVRHFTAAHALRPDSVLALGALGRTRRILGEFEASRTLLERAVDLDPENTWLHRELARTLDASGDHLGAVAAGREAVRLDPDDWVIRTELARLLQVAGDRAAALVQTQEAVQIAPESPGARAALASMMTHVADPRDGLTAAREATALDPAGADGPHAAGHALLELGRFDEAVQAFRTAKTLALPEEVRCTGEAEALLRLGRFGEAREAAAELLDRHPDDVNARIVLADVALALDQAEQAAELVRGILDDHPGNVAARMVEARIALGAENPGRVVDLCQEILVDHPNRADTLSTLGFAHGLLGDFDAAIDAFERSLAERPYQWSTLNLLGLALIEKGQARDSLEYFARALEITPDNQEILSSFFSGYMALGELRKAFETAERAHTLDPGYRWNEWRLGSMLQKSGDNSRAVEHLSRAVEQDSEHWDSWKDLGLALAGIGRSEEAIAAFERAVEIDPGDCHPYHWIGDLHWALGDLEQGAAVQRDSIVVNPVCPMGYKHLADIERSMGSYADAAEHYRQALERGPNSSAALFELASLLLSPGREPYDPIEAVGLAERLVDLESRAGLAWCTLGIARYRSGDHAGSLAALEQSLKLGMVDGRNRFFLAMVKRRLEEEGAVEEFERAQTWLRAQPAVDEELRAIEREARQLLGLPADSDSDR